MKTTTIPLLFIAIAFTACANDPTNDPSYVSTAEYQHYSCKQISAEMNRISKRTDNAIASQAKAKTSDQTSAILNTAVSALAITQGYAVYDEKHDIHDQQISRLQSQYDAIEKLSIQKNCTL